MIESRRVHLQWLTLLVGALTSTNAVYVSYETPRAYEEGERVPLIVNKLVSSVTLSSIDYSHLPLCFESSSVPQPIHPANAWDHAVKALHGDVYQEEPVLPLYFQRNIYCGQLCVLQLPSSDSSQGKLLQESIRNQYSHQFYIDNLPVALRQENQDEISMQYWGGIPIGLNLNDVLEDDRFRKYTNNTSVQQQRQQFIYNHYRIEILHNDQYILRTTVQPFSIKHNVTDVSKFPAVAMNEPMPKSCRDRSQHLPIYYGQLKQISPQPILDEPKPILFTYDVMWVPYESNGGNSKSPYFSRWSVFLQMDNGVPITVPLFSLIVGILVNGMLIGVLVTWILRDLSYKPLTIDVDEEVENAQQREEAQLWPLSTRVFFTPKFAPVLTFCCGTGAHWLVFGFAYVILFRCGLINESLGASLLTPAIVLYILASLPAGYITGRMCIVFHQSKLVALLVTLAVATVMPVVGMLVIHLVYDVLPDVSTAPTYHAIENATPVILTWLFASVPLTLVAAYWGYVHGPWSNFPVSTGSSGYQDLALQDDAQENQWETSEDECKSPICNKLSKCWYSNGRLPILFIIGGLPPLACGFVEYAYGVAGPIFMGYFSSSSFFAIASFVLFLTCVAAVSVLLYYKHIRMQNYQWWWASFVTGASSGLYIFLLSMSWVCLDASGRHVTDKTMLGYFLWFFYGSTCVGLMTGFVAVASCVLFSRTLYSILLRRSNVDMDQTSLLLEEHSRGSPTSADSLQPLAELDGASVDGSTGEASISGDGVMRRAKPPANAGVRDGRRIRLNATGYHRQSDE
ncbi:hypothetical protein MPSEU_000975100 [Mayamaea pseudoterrestris]|nr:hypothetical protein MPSEU_000975100 [Mayamaea pseudoterrestris]